MKSPVLASAAVTAVCLVGGMLVGVGAGLLVGSLPFHAPAQTMSVLGGITAFIGVFGGGALWGSLLAKIHNLPHRPRMAIAGGFGFGLSVMGAAPLLPALAGTLTAQQRLQGQPVHVIFTLVFVPATFLVATIGGGAILLVSGKRAHWFGHALAAGLAASASFLIIDLVLDSLGMRVGGPEAAERTTMLKVAFLSLAAGAFSGGAVLGRVLSGGGEAVAAAS